MVHIGLPCLLTLKKKEICYFDSYGEIPPRRIKKLAMRIVGQSNALPADLKAYKNFKFVSCSKRHQYSNSECGVYSLILLYNFDRQKK